MSAVAIQGKELDDLRLWVMCATNHLLHLSKNTGLDERDRKMCKQFSDELDKAQKVLYPPQGESK